MRLAKYLKVFDIGLQNTFVYRWNFLLRSVFGMVPLLGMLFLWGAIFEGRSARISGYDESGMIFYFLMTLLIDNWVAPTEDEWQIAAEIREGRGPIRKFVFRAGCFLDFRSAICGMEKSAPKLNGELGGGRPPAWGGFLPFFGNISQRQIDEFARRLVAWKMPSVF